MKPRPLRRTSQLTAAILAMLAHQASAQGVMTWDGGGTDANWLNTKPSSKKDTVDLASSTAGILGAVDVSVQLAGTLLADSSKSPRLQAIGKGGSRGGSSADAGGFANLGGGFSTPFENWTPGTLGDSFLTSATALGSSYTVGGGSDATLQFAGTSTPDSTSTPTSLLATSSATAPSPSLGISSSTSDSLQASSLAFDAALVAPVTSPSNSGTIGSDPPPVGQSNAADYIWADSNVSGTPTTPLNWFSPDEGVWSAMPVSDNTKTVQFFTDSTTILGFGTGTYNQVSNINTIGDVPFQLRALTLTGKAALAGDLTLTISGDPLNFSAALGTINTDANINGSGKLGFNVDSDIQLGTVSQVTALTIAGSGSGSFRINGDISENSAGATITKTGSSTVSIGGDNSYTGLTTISGGTLLVYSNTGLGAVSGGVTINDLDLGTPEGPMLQIARRLIDSTTPTVIGNEALSLVGTGVGGLGALNNLFGDNEYQGLITLTGNTKITSSGNTLLLSNAGTISGPGYGLTIGGSGNVTLNSILGTTSGTLTKVDSGTLTLTGTNTYTGSTAIQAGKVVITNSSALGGTTNGTVISDGAALEISGGIAVGAEATSIRGYGIGSGGVIVNTDGTNTYAGLLTLAESSRINSEGGSLTFTNTGAIKGSYGLTLGGASDLTINSVLQTNTGTLTKDGNGTATLTGANLNTGAITISGGTLSVATISNGGVSNTVTVSAGSVNATLQSITDVVGQFISSPAFPAGTYILSIVNAGGKIVKMSSAALVATSSGTTIGMPSNLGMGISVGDNLVFDGGRLEYTGDTSTTDRSFKITAGKTAFIDVTQAGSILTLSGGVTETTGALTKQGAGTLALSGYFPLAYTGQTTISNGTLQLGDGFDYGSLSTSSAIVIEADGNLTIDRYNTVTQGTDFNAIISGEGSLTSTGGYEGGGTLILNGENTYEGGTTVSGGTLVVSNTSGSGTGSGPVVIAAGATLKGTGTLAGDVTINGTHAPGNSPGIETVGGDLSYGSTSIFDWELIANTTTQGTSPSFTYDQVLMTGIGKTLNIDPGAKINLIFNIGSTVDFAQTAFWNQTRSWNIITGYTSFTGNFTINSISVDSLGHSSTNYPVGYPPGQFSMSGGTLTWTAVPEPTSALAGLLVTAGLLRRRRTQVVSQ